MGVERGLHCRDTKSVLWWENTVEGDSLEDQSKVVTILKWIQRNDACMWAGFYYSRIGTSCRML